MENAENGSMPTASSGRSGTGTAGSDDVNPGGHVNTMAVPGRDTHDTFLPTLLTPRADIHAGAMAVGAVVTNQSSTDQTQQGGRGHRGIMTDTIPAIDWQIIRSKDDIELFWKAAKRARFS